MFDELQRVSWGSFAQPDWNESDTVPQALLSVANASSNGEAASAYDKMLYALGNNHAGTYYPFVVPTLAFLAQIVAQCGSFAREAALDVLVDLLGAFHPEPGYEWVTGADGAVKDLRELVREGVSQMSSILGVVTDSEPSASRAKALAAELTRLVIQSR